MRADYRLACDQIAANTALLRPGTSFAELHDRAFLLPAPYRRQRYSCIFHGVGLCDEWPYITYPEDRMPGAFEGMLEPGMTLCVESLISREDGDFSIKLEEQVLVTDTGPEVLSRFPHDPGAGRTRAGLTRRLFIRDRRLPRPGQRLHVEAPESGPRGTSPGSRRR